MKFVARIQYKYSLLFVLFFILLTVFLGYGLTFTSFESDMTKEMPQQLPVYQLAERVGDAFGGQDSVIILMEINDTSVLNDIRDVSVIQFSKRLEDELQFDVDNIISPASFFRGVDVESLTNDDVVRTLGMIPRSRELISDDFTTAMVILVADVGSDPEKLDDLQHLIEDGLKRVPSVPGLQLTVTGNPSVMKTILYLLQRDSVYTLIIASLIIFFLLILLEQSFNKAVLVFIPLFTGIVWTIGALGWLGIKISVATAGLGAMLLGLGVEYGVFIVTRYTEEREKGKSQKLSLSLALPSVGSAMLGSGLTTIVGFMALSLSIMPMLQHLGQSLALGIFFCLIAAIFFSPVVILYEEKLVHQFRTRQHRKHKSKPEVNV